MRSRPAFSLVEVLIALVLLGVGAAGLASAQLGDQRLRAMAATHATLASRARDRWSALALLPCGADTAGTARGSWGRERWSATVADGRWLLVDSLRGPDDRTPILFSARVACPR
jgi:prepilin-type N-terminal cleavage/methylation domain-containing protein